MRNSAYFLYYSWYWHYFLNDLFNNFNPRNFHYFLHDGLVFAFNDFANFFFNDYRNWYFNSDFLCYFISQDNWFFHMELNWFIFDKLYWLFFFNNNQFFIPYFLNEKLLNRKLYFFYDLRNKRHLLHNRNFHYFLDFITFYKVGLLYYYFSGLLS